MAGITHSEPFDYVIVGSGVGGGTLAAELAAAGRSVCLIEAGPADLAEDVRVDYSVPAFHPFVTEAKSISWDFPVDHYADPQEQAKVSKAVLPGHKVWYPRSSVLGGCTAHNAMITIRPPGADWDRLAGLVGSDAWNARQLQPQFERLRNWLSVELPEVELAFQDAQITELLLRLLTTEALDTFGLKPPFEAQFIIDWCERVLDGLPIPDWLLEWLNPNNPFVTAVDPVSAFVLPLATKKHHRVGTRERLLELQQQGNLHIFCDTLATEVLLEGNKATGVRCLQGRHLYRASPLSANANASTIEFKVTQEVILAGGAFNTPQLLMLSGIGPEDELARHRIDCRVPLPGVGKNLQDRYEVPLVYKYPGGLELLQDAELLRKHGQIQTDGPFEDWRAGKPSVYGSNGGLISLMLRSKEAGPSPDLLIFALPGDFRGYKPGYSSQLLRDDGTLTWLILKAYTRNKTGTVRLASKDALDCPKINFNSFAENGSSDIAALKYGIEFVETIMKEADNGKPVTRIFPRGPLKDEMEQEAFIRYEAWGHHACGTCRMGPEGDYMAVLDSQLRVRGVSGLRVVDASVFPDIPGHFIAAAVYMVAHQAAELIQGT